MKSNKNQYIKAIFSFFAIVAVVLLGCQQITMPKGIYVPGKTTKFMTSTEAANEIATLPKGTPLKVRISEDIAESDIGNLAAALKGTEGEVSIDLSGTTITALKENAFKDAKGLSGLSLPETVTEIGKNAFAGSGIKELSFTGSAPTTVSADAFDNNAKVTVTVPADKKGEFENAFAALISSGIVTIVSENSGSDTGDSDDTGGTDENQIVISYSLNGASTGKTPESITVKKNDKATLAPAVTEARWQDKPGYSFDKWNTSADGQGISYEAGTEIDVEFTEDTVLYAIPVYNGAVLSFDVNNGKGSVESITVVKGDTATINWKVKPTRDATVEKTYVFAGWASAADASAAEYTDGGNSTIELTADKTLYAVWTETANTVTITYSLNGATGTLQTQTQTVNVGAEVTIAAEPSNYQVTGKNNHVFDSWNTATGGTGTRYTAGQKVSEGFTTNTILYAISKDAGSNTLTYDANGGTGAPAAQSIGKTETSATINFSTVPTRAASRTHTYQFIGWSETKADPADNPTATYTSTGTTTVSINADKILYAVWKQIPIQIRITYNINGATTGSTPNEQTVNAGHVQLSNATSAFRWSNKPGYVFDKWNTAQNGSGNSYESGQTVELYADTTLYATSKYNGAVLTYYANGGDKAPTAKTVVKGESINIDWSVKPVRAQTDTHNYEFLGWAETENAQSATYSNNTGSITMNSDKKLYAVWKVTVRGVTLTFSLDGAKGTPPTSRTVPAGTVVELTDDDFPNVDTGTGYRFIGWSTTRRSVTAKHTKPQYSKNGNRSVTVNANMTLYAQYQGLWTHGLLGYTGEISYNPDNQPINSYITRPGNITYGEGIKKVFQQNEGGTFSGSNARIPTLLSLPNGDLLGFADRRYANSGDIGGDNGTKVETWVKWSKDSGHTWSEGQRASRQLQEGNELATSRGDAGVVYDKINKKLITMTIGNAGIWYGKADRTSKVWMRRGTVNYEGGDERFGHITGITWEDEVDVTANFFGPGCSDPTRAQMYAGWVGSGNGLQTTSGRIFFAIAIRRWNNNGNGLTPGKAGYSGDQGALVNYAIYSDNGGDTWQVSENSPTDDSQYGTKSLGLNSYGDEASIAELPDGRLMMLIRPSGAEGFTYQRTISYSSNNGRTWTKGVQHADLPASQSVGGGLMYTAKSAGWDRDRVLTCFDIQAYDNADHGMTKVDHTDNGKMPLRNDQGPGCQAMFVSYDNSNSWYGRCWYIGKIAYSSFTILQDGSIGILAEDGGNWGSGWISFFRVTADWVTGNMSDTDRAKGDRPAVKAQDKPVRTAY